jgi:hypothetical protein
MFLKTKMKNLFKQLGRDSWLESRLVWLAEKPDAAPVQVEKVDKKESLDALKPGDVARIAERIKDLNVPETKIRNDDKPVDAVNFLEALRGALNPNMKNLDLVLMQGLLENVADIKPSEMGNKEKKDFTEWLKKKEIVSFEIKDKVWNFYSKDTNGKKVPVKAEYKLNY